MQIGIGVEMKNKRGKYIRGNSTGHLGPKQSMCTFSVEIKMLELGGVLWENGDFGDTSLSRVKQFSRHSRSQIPQEESDESEVGRGKAIPMEPKNVENGDSSP